MTMYNEGGRADFLCLMQTYYRQKYELLLVYDT